MGVSEKEQSVHLREFPEVRDDWRNDALALKWQVIYKMRKSVLEAIEPLRASKELGSSLEAFPKLSVSKEDMEILNSVNMEDVCITSQIKVSEGDFVVNIDKSDGEKCARCWKVLPEVSKDTNLCNRCAKAIGKYKAKSL